MKARREGLEEKIAQFEADITTRELELATFKSAKESIRLSKLIEQNRARLAEMMAEWVRVRSLGILCGLSKCWFLGRMKV